MCAYCIPLQFVQTNVEKVVQTYCGPWFIEIANVMSDTNTMSHENVVYLIKKIITILRGSSETNQKLKSSNLSNTHNLTQSYTLQMKNPIQSFST